MPSTAREWILFALGASVLAVLVALIVAQETRSSPTHKGVAPAVSKSTSPPSSLPPPALSSAPTAAEAGSAATTATDAFARTQQAQLVLTATRGDSWLMVRSSSATGKILYEGTLTQGHALRLTGNAFWARFGSASHLDASLDGKPVPLGTGTLDTVIKP